MSSEAIRKARERANNELVPLAPVSTDMLPVIASANMFLESDR